MKNNALWASMIGILSAFTINTYAVSPPPVPAPVGYEKTISEFIDAHMTNNFKEFREVMDVEAVVIVPRGETLLKESKAALVSEMRSEGPGVQNCTSSFVVMAKSDALVMARVDFEYNNATQHDFLVIEKNADLEWKIAEVYQVIEDKPEASPANELTKGK